MIQSNSINLLWTGGWDSTFRLLELVLLYKQSVQPYYIVDPDRSSLGMELRAIRKIKERLFADYPETTSLIFPAILKDKNDIEPNMEITESYQEILNKRFLGSQYEWLSRFAFEHSLEDLEMGSLKNGNIHKTISPFIRKSNTANGLVYELKEDALGTAEYSLFGYFKFPCLHLDKHDIELLSKKWGFMEFMELTWFCHRSGPVPCGQCNPCRYTVNLGMKKRIPIVNRFRYHISAKRRIKVLTKKLRKSGN